MFKKLKRRIILTNLLTTTIVLVIAFAAIYLAVANTMHHRAPFKPNWNDAQPEIVGLAPEFTAEMEEHIQADRQAALNTLLVALVISGACVEAMVFLLSLYLSEQSVRPVREAYEAQKAFIANASHEIKTPLAVIQANLEAAEIKDNHWIDNVIKKTDDLARLNQQLLALAQVDAQISQQPNAKINLAELVANLTEPLSPQLAKIKFKIDNKALAKPWVEVVEADLKQLLNILLDNAIKYCAQKITIRMADGTIVITNDGTTIKPSDLPHIFERFYQTDKTRAGVGLGLSIAKQLADRNGWKLSASSNSKTTTFKLVLS